MGRLFLVELTAALSRAWALVLGLLLCLLAGAAASGLAQLESGWWPSQHEWLRALLLEGLPRMTRLYVLSAAPLLCVAALIRRRSDGSFRMSGPAGPGPARAAAAVVGAELALWVLVCCAPAPASALGAGLGVISGAEAWTSLAKPMLAVPLALAAGSLACRLTPVSALAGALAAMTLLEMRWKDWAWIWER